MNCKRLRCTGYRHGTGCKKITKNPYAHNWTVWQQCFECANIIHPEFYANRPKRGTGGKYLKEGDSQPMIFQYNDS